VPLDVTRVRLKANQPVIACTGCRAMIVVPIFDPGNWREKARSSGAPEEGSGPADATVPAPPLETEEEEEEEGEEEKPPVVEREERRDPGAATTHSIPCRDCGQQLDLGDGGMRLTVTHAVIRCPACSAEVRVRRNDAFRATGSAVAWGFASYAEESTDEVTPPDTTPSRGRLARLWNRGEHGRTS
jgi:DNA-directed RNA polymerase subunit RPC12/RpoP